MYTRDEASRLKQEFWTTFGRYMNPILSSDGLKVNWINYHTRVKDLYFRMEADNKSAFIAISVEHMDAGMRELCYEQLLELQLMLHESLGEDWIWQPAATDATGRPLSRIFTELPGISIFNKSDWHALISFFKPRIIALDAFWENARYSFD